MVEPLHAHVCFPSLSKSLDQLALPTLKFTHGAEDEVPSGTVGQARVLVAGRPSVDLLDGLPRLEFLVVPYVGIPARTMRLLDERPQIRLLHIHHNAVAVAEGALALAFAASRRVVPMHESLKRLDWSPRYQPDPALRLAGRRALLLGFGAIGRRIAPVLEALGMEVSIVRRLASAESRWSEFTSAELPQLLPQSDLLIACLPSTPATRGLLGSSALSLLPQHAVVVNVGRADLFDEEALFESLRDRRIGAAGLDVWWSYPRSEPARLRTPPSAYPFHELDNVVLSPHRTGHDDRVETDRLDHLVELLSLLAEGQPIDSWLVDRDAGY